MSDSWTQMQIEKGTLLVVRFRTPSKHRKNWFDHHETQFKDTDDVTAALQNIKAEYPDAIFDSINVYREQHDNSI